MKYASKSVIGKRLENEDSLRVPQTEESVPLIAVADGMGGHVAGKLASSLSIDALAEQLSAVAQESNLITALQKAVHRVNVTVFRKSKSDPMLSGMGSTLVCALLSEKRFVAANIGDSRLYHFDGNELTQVTVDHSFVQMLVNAGSITAEEARIHPQRNLITRAIGISMRTDADVFDREWKTGDILLLCSDGLSGSISDEDIAEVLRNADLTLDGKCDLLVERALSGDGSDNITVVLACCEGESCA